MVLLNALRMWTLKILLLFWKVICFVLHKNFFGCFFYIRFFIFWNRLTNDFLSDVGKSNLLLRFVVCNKLSSHLIRFYVLLTECYHYRKITFLTHTFPQLEKTLYVMCEMKWNFVRRQDDFLKFLQLISHFRKPKP